MSFVVHQTVGGQTRLTSVERQTLRIGRGANAELRLDDDAVALEHASIQAVSTGWVLLDHGSVTGTYVNGKPVSHAELSTGDVIEIGDCRIKVQVTHPDDPLFLHLELPPPPAPEPVVPPAEVAPPIVGGPADAGAETGTRKSDTRPVPIVREPPPAPAEVPSPAPSPPTEPSGPPSPPDRAAAGPSSTAPVPVEAARAAAAHAAAAAPTRPAAGAAEVATAPRIDYARAYALARPGLTKASLTLGLTLLAVLLLAGAVTAGVRGWFMPGISSAHGRIVGAAPRAAVAGETGDPASAPLAPRAAAAAELGCLACHRPWRGPVEAGCAECHAPQAAPHAVRQVSAPACSACHPEHRPGQPLIVTAEGTGCVSCHGDLAVTEGEIRVASRITSFADDHPELVVTPIGAGPGAGRALAARVSLASPGGRGSDPGRLAFNHQVHLAADLRGPEGAVQLACGDCHAVSDDRGLMAPIAFAEHCQSCHRLTFDPAYPDREAPHAAPQEVEDFLVGLYSRADSGSAAAQSLRQRRLGIIRGGGRQRLPPGVDRQVVDAGRTLFRSQCDLCHQMDLDATPLPLVTPPELPWRWLARARFSHLDHGEVACNECHLAVRDSRETSDVLLPGIAECRSCHGAAGAAVEAARWGGLLGCAQCHAYHPPPPPSASVVAALPAASLPAVSLTGPVAGDSLFSTVSTMQSKEGGR